MSNKIGEQRHREITVLRGLRDKLLAAGVPTNDIDNKIRHLAIPRLYETLYRRPDGTEPVIVMAVEDVHVSCVPEGTQIINTHAGNLYDADGNSPYAHIP